MTLLDNERSRFEERAFGQRFLRGVKKTDPNAQFGFTVDCPPMDEFLRRHLDGDYIDPTLDAMWWAWRAAKGLA